MTGVATRHKDYDAYVGQWTRVRDAISGQDAIYAKSVAYLPRLLEEDDTSYNNRLNRTPFYNASWRTVAAFVGMLFRKPPNVEVPATIEKLLDDVTLTGVSFNSFAQEIALEDIAISRVGVLVDFPRQILNADGTMITLAESESLNLRPIMTMFKAESIINWHYGYVGNKFVLTQVRLSEIVVEPKTEFDYISKKRIKVLDLTDNGLGGYVYRQRIFDEQNGKQLEEDIIPIMDGKPLDYIPFYLIGPDGAQTAVSEPILIDLIDLNLKHFMVSADYEHGCHMTGLPTPVISGVEQRFDNASGLPIQQNYYIGSSAAWILPLHGTATFLEFSGQGLQAIEKNLASKEAQMAAIGARMLTPEKAGIEAADTLAMRNAGEHSILSAVAIAISTGLTRALETFVKWGGAVVTDDSVKFEINRDFMPYPITPQAMTSLLATVQAGKMSDESFFDLLKRGDLIDADIKFEDEQARIDENSQMPGPVLDPNNPNAADPKAKPLPGQKSNLNG